MEGLEEKVEFPQKFKDAILDAIGEGISIINEDLKIVWVKPIIEKWAGPLDDLLGKARSCGYCWQANNQ